MIKYRMLYRRNTTTKNCRPVRLNYYYRLRCDSMQSGGNIGLLTFWMNLLPLLSVCYADDGYRHKNYYIFYKIIRRHVLQHYNLHIAAMGSSKPTHTRLNCLTFDVRNFNFFTDVSDYIYTI